MFIAALFTIARTCVGMHAKSLQSCQLWVTPYMVAYQSLLSMGVSRKVYCCGLPSLPPGDLPNPAVEPGSFMSPGLAWDSLSLVPLGKPCQDMKAT